MHDATKWNDWLNILRRKWSEVPGDGASRLFSPIMLEMGDDELLAFWSATRDKDSTGDRFCVRGWYHLLYKDVFKGRKIVDVGSGFGMDALTFAEAGVDVTCVDIVKTNLLVIKRLAHLKGLSNVHTHYIDSMEAFTRLDDDFDAIWCQGSLINAPYEMVRAEVQELVRHLKPGGRFVELAYPEERWAREGSMPFEKWGEKTDGAGTPYVEWYDLGKVVSLFAPVPVDVVLAFNFYNDNFNWFDLVVNKTR